jgi:hypothetical protein
MQLDETHGVFLGPGEGESIRGPHRELHVKLESDELEVLELVCEPAIVQAPSGGFIGRVRNA